ncbi:hypothetical protein AK812_SmicGene13779 [Symbiodinium microadriaticum]|uniref:Uncharacterized protein n=1 Tax=Symbiodinium microadriaticum TaxID=2951 RepID=A0A1Q9E7A4_SYMMI|nr:hypothetical protein AK812_SmicGene13779 [Symbiodinium microadriaticum]
MYAGRCLAMRCKASKAGEEKLRAAKSLTGLKKHCNFAAKLGQMDPRGLTGAKGDAGLLRLLAVHNDLGPASNAELYKSANLKVKMQNVNGSVIDVNIAVTNLSEKLTDEYHLRTQNVDAMWRGNVRCTWRARLSSTLLTRLGQTASSAVLARPGVFSMTEIVHRLLLVTGALLRLWIENLQLHEALRNRWDSSLASVLLDLITRSMLVPGQAKGVEGLRSTGDEFAVA